MFYKILKKFWTFTQKWTFPQKGRFHKNMTFSQNFTNAIRFPNPENPQPQNFRKIQQLFERPQTPALKKQTAHKKSANGQNHFGQKLIRRFSLK